MKAGLTTGGRPKLSALPRIGLIHGCRGIEFGIDKYVRGNYHGPAPEALHPDPQVRAVLRLLGYIDATQRHLTKVADALNRALGTGGDLVAAASTVDDVASAGFRASRLPDLSHAISSLLIGVTCAADDGLLPEDPGRPWDAFVTGPSTMAGKSTEEIRAAQADIPQKDNPAAEKARVEALRARGIVNAGPVVIEVKGSRPYHELDAEIRRWSRLKEQAQEDSIEGAIARATLKQEGVAFSSPYGDGSITDPVPGVAW
jgi:hypothetical protein